MDPSQSGTHCEQLPDPVQLAARRSLAEALRLTGAGYALTPVTITRLESGKKSARFHKGWRHEGAWSRDPDQIKAWWLDHDGCSFALGGAANGVEGVDLDVKPGTDGEVGINAVAWWAERGLPLGALTQVTPSGGRHLIWSAGGGATLPQEAGKSLGRGVDTRNRSGLFFAAGAYVLGLDGKPEHGHYEIDGPLPALADLAPTPDEVLELFASAARAQQAERERVADGSIVVKDREWVRAETAKARAAIVGHGREDSGYRAKIQHLAMFYGRVVEMGRMTAQQAEDDWRAIHTGVWGPVVFGENVKDFRDALRDGPARERWRYRETDPEVRTGELGAPTEHGDDVTAVELEIRAELRKLQIRDEARRRFTSLTGVDAPAPGSVSLAALLVEDIPGENYRVDRLWPAGGKVLLAAPQKSGKTTLVGNLVRCLVDGDRFLGRDPSTFRAGEWRVEQAGGFATTRTDRTVFLLDFEMTRRQLQRWLREQRIANSDRVHVELLRGRRWDPRDERERAQWATHLRSLNVGTVIVDPAGPVLAALDEDENENGPVRRFLHALDALVAESGADDLFVTHHTGHEGERARGASAWGDWPDALWKVAKQSAIGAPVRTFFSATGRDVWQNEAELLYDRDTRRLSLGQGDRVSTRSAGDAEIIAEIVSNGPGQTGREIRTVVRDTEIGSKQQRAVDAISAARAGGLVHVHTGPNRAHFHFPGPSCEACTESEVEA